MPQIGENSDQQEINRREWANPDNWSGPAWLSVYFSKRDSRVWVPKRIPAMGWTVNLGRTGGVLWMIGIFMGIVLLVVAINIITVALAARSHG
ncbi:MAG: hypothetical protein JXL80_07965 [Planctomycetes bacterium]|nr:hypothetical protein [Planctomycetota bacterium]